MISTRKSKLALILGSGFSRAAKLPTTSEIVDDFIKSPSAAFNDNEIESAITDILKQFWCDIFNYRNSAPKPSLEDHFTVIDLAANSGHHIGPYYSPKKLRAVRRMSIHRIFRILDQKYEESDAILRMLQELNECFELQIISLNWDIVLEKNLRILNLPFDYAIDVHDFNCLQLPKSDLHLLKMHGSSNWVYCDSCRRIFTDLSEKSALHRRVYLEETDFKEFGFDNIDMRTINGDRSCCNCGNKLAGRVATFSYRKAFSIAQFQTIWDRAHSVLSSADTWLFIGYSLPQADFEFTHLLKSAQLGRHNVDDWSIQVIISRRPETANRYKSFFGVEENQIKTGGLVGWVNRSMELFKKNHCV